MKKIVCALSLSFPLVGFASQTEPKTCEDVGARTETHQVVADTGHGRVRLGEPQKVCILVDGLTSTLVSERALLSKNANLAATAYRTAPKPVLTPGSTERPDKAYCRSLGGAHQVGAVSLNAGWENVESEDGVSAMCVFTDGSMLSTWALFYKRSGLPRPDFEPFFQNEVVPTKLW